ncbi:MAG: Hsp20/alpha crystallin family protein [Candidatus Bathyarchaeota archaeon]|nr:Hsp20/alpha crystallin family protein [Candidatus Termiticorpusculum sp.]
MFRDLALSFENDDDDLPEWFKKRRAQSKGPFFGDIDNMFREVEKMMEDEFKSFQEKGPKEYVKERKLPDGSTVKELGPFVYGYSMKIGPDGKPDIQEFGNVKKSHNGPEVKEEREPLVDVVNNAEEIQVVVELPGVEKTDIKLHGTEDALTISVDTSPYKYYKEIELPVKTRIKEARSTYKNGVLEVVIPKLEPLGNPKGDPINIS